MGLISLHVVLILLGYGAYGLAAVSAAMYLTQEHNLKFDKLNAILSLLPPIQRLDKVGRRLILSGLIMMVIGLVIGFGAVRASDELSSAGDAKVYWSVFMCGMYGTLLILRWRLELSGRRFAWGAIICFVFF